MGKSDRHADFDSQANRHLSYAADCRQDRDRLNEMKNWANEVNEDDLPESYWTELRRQDQADYDDEELSCEICGNPGDRGPDPYDLDIHGDDTEHILCVDCHNDRWMER